MADKSFQKSEFDKRFESLKSEFNLYSASGQDIAQYINPTRGLFNSARPQRGKMVDHKILLDAYATQSCRKSASGLNSGITSKARPWFRLTLSSGDLAKLVAVRMWLDEVQKRMYAILEGSNFYGVAQSIYEELLTFGTGCFIMLEDVDTVIRFRNFTFGEYYLGTNDKGRVDTFGREIWLTVAQMIKKFGYDNCSAEVKSAWENNRKDEWIQIRHLIEPNMQRDPVKVDFTNMPYRSMYWETGSRDEVFLAQRGFKRFNIISPRWMIPTTDVVYGYGPGWDALGDVKELQKVKFDKLLAQEKLHNPPMQQDANVDGYANLLPGGVTKTTANVPNAGLTPAYQINPNMESFIQLAEQCYQSIDRHFFTDLFTQFATLDDGQRTATEIAAKEQERVLLMGPILNNLDEEMLSKVIELLFEIMEENGLIPPPPEEIQGQEIKVQYISILAQAQRAVGVTGIQKVIGFAGEVSAIWPEARHNINIDEAIREVADMEGAPVKILNEEETIDEMREQEAQVQNLQGAAQSIDTAANVGKTLSETELDKNSALDKVVKGAQQ
jgi:hypothetical protein